MWCGYTRYRFLVLSLVILVVFGILNEGGWCGATSVIIRCLTREVAYLSGFRRVIPFVFSVDVIVVFRHDICAETQVPVMSGGSKSDSFAL
jgi:hypothetical protein